MDLLSTFQEQIKKQHLFSPKDKLLLAVSGGVDSVVLCELCKQSGFDFSIVHCNFKLRGAASDSDEEFVRLLATKYGVEFNSKSFDTKAIALQEKKSIEETARDLRYGWFSELMTPDSGLPTPPDFVLTGHHADDNIETVTMNFFRGTGIKGLRGILPKNNKVIRPLLFARRNELEEFALLHQLKYVIDHTNLEAEFTRNFFRNKVLPEVMEFYPGADKNILNNIERFEEIEELYNQAVTLHKSKLLEAKGNEIHIPVLKLKKSVPVKSILFEIIKEFGFTAHQTDEVIAILDSESGKYVASSTHRIIKNRSWLIIAPLQSTKAVNILIEEGEQNISFQLGTLKLETTKNHKPETTNTSVTLDSKDIKFPLLLRKWKMGDYFYPLGMKKKKKLNRFLIDLKLSKTQKENVWVLESNKKIIWVVGHRIDERFKIADGTKTVLQAQFISGQTE